MGPFLKFAELGAFEFSKKKNFSNSSWKFTTENKLLEDLNIIKWN